MVDRRERGGLRGALSRWISPEAESDAGGLRRNARCADCVPVAEVADRAQARVMGTLQSLTLQPRAGTPALEADLFDGSGTVTLVWLGRRRITGVACGGRLIAAGRISTLDGRRVMFNPRYELLPVGTE